MTQAASTRFPALFTALAGAVVCVCVCMSVPAHCQHQHPAPIERRPAPPPQQQFHPQPGTTPQAPVQPPPHGNGGQKLPNGQHLGGWLESHSNLTPAQQQQALEKEPGFHDLPPQTQQRYRDRLAQLSTMPVQQREKVISRTEWMERLPPDRRIQVRNALQQWGSLPTASHRAVGRTFRIVRGMPPAQRLAYLNSPDIRSQFSPAERDTLTHLMQVEPYLPAGSGPNF